MSGTGSWDANGIREPGNAVHDPETGLWIYTWTGIQSGGNMNLGAATSPDGLDWTPLSNPISGSDLGEDPYLAKNTDGTLYRDPSGRALLFSEEKDTGAPDSQRGIEMWRSGADVLTGWTLFGRVLDKGSSGWDQNDRTSPVVVHDGTQLVMLFEGRSPTNDGEVGVAFSSDDGETWSLGSNPIITRSSGWRSNAVVPDDVILVAGTWVLLCHGQPTGGNFYNMGRFATTDDPADWDSGSFTEMTGNPFTHITNTLMCWGNDPTRAIYINSGQDQTRHVAVAEG